MIQELLTPPILLPVRLFHLRGDDIVSTPGDDIYHCETESTDAQPILGQTHDESSSFEIMYPPYSPSVAQPRSFGQIGHISTRSSDSQPQASATEYVVLSALHQAQGKPDTKCPRAPHQVRLQTVGFTGIGLFARQPPILVKAPHVGVMSDEHNGKCPTCETSGIG